MTPAPPMGEEVNLLEVYLRAANEAEAAVALERLIELEALPVIRGVARRKSWNVDRGDVEGEALLRLVARLRAMRAGDGEPIDDFRAYVAVIAFNAVHGQARERSPQRWRLASRIRYAVRREPFGRWEERGELVCGFSRAAAAEIVSADAVASAAAGAVTPAVLDSADALIRALKAVFLRIGGRCRFDELVEAFVDASGASLQSSVQHEDLAEPTSFAPVEAMDRLERLRALWREISALPARQREALLLHVRDESGRAALELFVLLGVANLAAIAAALESSVEEVSELILELPWDDLRIAARMNVSRQQVINLRKSARDRLSRRLQKIFGGVVIT
jgi:RNA polymerase sigma factor (sigma-70 family)